MANERLTLLMKQQEPQYSPENPVLLLACALYRDTVTGKCVAQMKWRNLDQRPVKAVLVELEGFDAFERKL